MSDSARITHLVYKPTGEECIAPGPGVPAFAAVDSRGFSPSKVTPAHSARLDGDRLIVTFEPLVTVASFKVKATKNYLAITLERIGGPGSYKEAKAWYSEFNEETQPFEEFRFMELPLRERGTFGKWLNVDWDKKLAIALLATDPAANVTSEETPEGRVLGSSMWPRIRTAPVGIALVVCPPSELLGKLGHLEEDFNLPSGAKSRLSPQLSRVCWEVQEPLTSENVGKIIDFAKLGGIRQLQVYHGAVTKSVGHFALRPEYPNGLQDVHDEVARLNRAGITVGVHLHFDKTGINDPYLSPVPDPRLNLRRHFTLAGLMPEDGGDLEVDEIPEGVTLDDGRRILRFGNELVSYTSTSTEPPYRFKGITRAVMGTKREDHPVGQIGGLLDVDNWPVWVRFNQDTTIQDEVADVIARVYHGAGFQFTYFDGSEDVPPPSWFQVSNAQFRVYRKLKPEPLFSEASHFSHFDWHMMSRSHAEDTPRPMGIKALIRTRRLAEAASWAKDFTTCDFGWIRFYPGDAQNLGMQPDIIEYAASRGFGWHCSLSITGQIEDLRANPRTPDNLEVLRRWQSAVDSGWLDEEKRVRLREPYPEHTLLVDEKGGLELDADEELTSKVASLRAFLVHRPSGAAVAFWDVTDSSRIRLPLPPSSLCLSKDLGHPIAIESDGKGGSILPVAGRQYIEPRGISDKAFLDAVAGATAFP